MRKLNQLISQQQPLAGQVRNSAGGYAYQLNDAKRLEQFLILGSEAGSYYASPQALTMDNLDAVTRFISTDGVKAVRIIADVSTSGRAPRQDPALFALAIALKMGDLNTRRAALDAVPKVVRTASMLATFAGFVQSFGGWGRLTRRAFARFFTEHSVKRLSYQAIKYRSRAGWTQRDLLRKSHPVAPTDEHQALYKWMTTGTLPEKVPEALRQIEAFERCRGLKSVQKAVRLIRDHRLPREAVPNELLGDVRIWQALLADMPMGAMVRNLGKMSQVGLLDQKASCALVVSRLRTSDAVRKSRLHPLAILAASTVYGRGKGVRGSLTWKVNKSVNQALDGAFKLAFANVKRTGLRWSLAVDVSGSMSWSEIAGIPGITPAVGAAAMSLITHAVEDHTDVSAFSTRFAKVKMPKDATLRNVQKAFSVPMGGTDCAVPIMHALKHRLKYDVFVIYTDSETWHGKIHPAQALRRYRDQMGINAKLIVCGMVSNGFSIADPKDLGMLDVVGFDAAAPAVMADFASR